jgi:hypothetical protein
VESVNGLLDIAFSWKNAKSAKKEKQVLPPETEDTFPLRELRVLLFKSSPPARRRAMLF